MNENILLQCLLEPSFALNMVLERAAACQKLRPCLELSRNWIPPEHFSLGHILEESCFDHLAWGRDCTCIGWHDNNIGADRNLAWPLGNRRGIEKVLDLLTEALGKTRNTVYTAQNGQKQNLEWGASKKRKFAGLSAPVSTWMPVKKNLEWCPNPGGITIKLSETAPGTCLIPYEAIPGHSKFWSPEFKI